MKTRSEENIQIPAWWFILPVYLTLWTVGFSLYNYLDGNGMMQNFGIDTGGASDFIMLNSAGRYLAIALGMILGIWVFRTYHSILLSLLIRLAMDILDLLVGIRTSVIEDYSGIMQSFLMFLLPGLISIGFLVKFRRSNN